MLESVITRKGQTTIPKKIRELLNLKPKDRVFYLVEEGKVILKPLHGDILELRGSVPAKRRPEDFEAVRAAGRKKIVKNVMKDRKK
ncbi:MAG: type II toxin-antitoxin system PrlF family antitoxin [Deltaproteobacteria bacterium]|nr:type II toxin-antitoxin system PrlF family antitoxin [Deltaproteobacteria bacterium]